MNAKNKKNNQLYQILQSFDVKDDKSGPLVGCS